MTIEDYRREIVKTIHDTLPGVMVLRDGGDINVDFPLIVVAFFGPSRRRYQTLALSGSPDTGAWTLQEDARIYFYTMQGDGDRIQLQEMVNEIETMGRKVWPEMAREHGCAIFYPTSFLTTYRSTYYNEVRVNSAIMSLSVQVPRIVEGIEPEYPKNVVEKVTINEITYEE